MLRPGRLPSERAFGRAWCKLSRLRSRRLPRDSRGPLIAGGILAATLLALTVSTADQLRTAVFVAPILLAGLRLRPSAIMVGGVLALGLYLGSATVIGAGWTEPLIGGLIIVAASGLAAAFARQRAAAGKRRRGAGRHTRGEERAGDAPRVGEAEARVRLALGDLPILVFFQDSALRYIWARGPYSGFDPAAIPGKSDVDLFPPQEAARLLELKRKALAGQTVRQDVWLTVTGRRRCFDLSLRPLQGALGEIVGLSGVLSDVTERKLIEEREHQRAEAESARAGLALVALRDPSRLRGEAVALLASALEVPLVGLFELEDDEAVLHAGADWPEGTADRARLPLTGTPLAAALTVSEPLVLPALTEADAERLPLLHERGVRALLAVVIRPAGAPAALLLAGSPTPRVWTGEEIARVRAVAELLEAAGARLAVEQAAARSADRLDALFTQHPDAVLTLDLDGSVRSGNLAAEQLLGQPIDQLAGMPAVELFMPADAEVTAAQLALAIHGRARRWPAELRRAGGPRSVRCSALLSVIDGHPGELLLLIQDASEETTLRAQLGQGLYDPATRLANPALLHDYLARALERSARRQSLVAVVSVGLAPLDGAGAVDDRLLAAAVDRLRGVLRAGDLLARGGPDELVLVLEEVADAGDVLAVAERLVATIQPLGANETTRERGPLAQAWAGVALATAGHQADDLLRRAAVALGWARASNSRAALYDPSLGMAALDLLQLRHDLRHTLSTNELQLRYEPIFSVDGRLFALEAHAVWLRANHGVVAGQELRALLRQVELETTVGWWSLERATAEAAAWERDGGADLVVPLAPGCASAPDLAELVIEALVSARLDPERVILAIEEGPLAGAALEQLRRLRSRGVRLLLDGFGGGRLAPAQLTALGADVYRIDRSLTGEPQPLDEGVVAGLARLVHGLDGCLAATGVTTAERFQLLSRLGCDLVQGSYVAPLLSAEEVAAGHPRFAGR